MPATIPVGGLTFASIGVTAVVVGNAYYQKKQFYPSVVYITKSNPSLAAIYFLAFTIVILLGKLLKKVFFGQLRAAEFEQLLERSFYAVTETCLAFTVFRDDFSPKFVSLFTVLLFLKAFHYLTDSRVDFMERSPIITMLFHIRVTSLLLLLMLLDLLLLKHSYFSTLAHGASVQLVFGFEYAILLTVGFNIGVKYICHSIDLRSENPWENKAVYLLYTELLVGFVKVVLYLIFLIIMVKIHTFPLFIIRPMYLTARSFKNALNDVIQSRRAIHNMNTLYPDASPEELSAVDNVCIICREEMVTGAKKLPCGHIFHSSCLRSWFQRQQTCPTCRMDILQQPTPIQGPQQGAAAPQQQQQQQQQQQPQQTPAQPQQPAPGDARANNPLGFPFIGTPFGQNLQQGFRPQFPFAPFAFNVPLQQQQQQQPASQTASTSEAGASGTAGATGSAASSSGAAPQASGTSTGFPKTGFPFGALPPFLPFMPFNIPPPTPPPNFEGLTLDELKAMEGNERSHVETRIKSLRNIQVLLDAASIQLSQYNSVVRSLEAQAAVSSQAAEKTKAEASSEPNDSVIPAQKDEDEVPLTRNASSGDATSVSPPSEPPETSTPPPSPTAVSSPSSSTSCEAVGASGDDDPNEIRRRRLEKFTSSGSQGSSSPPSPSCSS